MPDNKKEPTFELHSWFDSGDIFFRPKDKKRFADALDAVVEDELGVAIIGSNETVIDHYSRMLIARLRKLERFSVDVFLPITTDSLLIRFNDMLSEMSLEQAAAPPSPEQPVRCLVINDARVINDDQWALLVRLLGDFPGVNARLILVINKLGWPGHEKLLKSLGKRMHRWPTQAPAIEEARQLLTAAEESGYQIEAEALLVDAGMGTLVASRHNDDNHEPLDPDLPDLPDLNVDVLLGVTAEDEESPAAGYAHGSEEGPNDRRPWLVIMLITLSLALSLLVLSWLYPNSLSATDSSSQKATIEGGSIETLTPPTYRIESIPVPTEEQLEAKQLAQEKVAQEIVAQETAAAEQKDPESTLQIESLDKSSASQPLSVDLAVTGEPVIDQPLREETVLERPAADGLSPEATIADVAVTDLMRAAQVLSSAPPNAYFVQHIVLSSELAAKAYVSRYPILGEAAVVPLRLSQKNAYGVVSGPFTTRAAAALFTQDSAVPDDYWIRSAAQLQAILRR